MPVEIGVHQINRVPFENLVGPVTWLRHFVSTSSAPPHSQWTQISTFAGLGYRVLTSFKPTGAITAIPGGAEDAKLTSIGNFLAGVPAVSAGPHVWCFFHEMDNESFTAAEYKAAADYVYPFIKALAPAWKTAIILTGGFTGQPWNGRDPDDYWPTSFAIDYLGADYYNQRGASLSSGQLFALASRPDRDISDVVGMVAKAVGHGAKLMFPEFASSVENNAGGPALRAAFIQNFADTYRDNPNIAAVMYYEQDQLSSPQRVNWRISGGFLAPEPASGAAFTSFTAGDPPTPGTGWGGPWGSLPWGGAGAGGTKSVLGQHLAVPVTMHSPKTTYRIAMAPLPVTVTLHPPAVAPPPGTQAIGADHLAVAVTLHPPRVVETQNIIEHDHLAVPVTFYDPSITSLITAAHLAVPVTMFAPISITQPTLPDPTAHVFDTVLHIADVGDRALHTANVSDREQED